MMATQTFPDIPVTPPSPGQQFQQHALDEFSIPSPDTATIVNIVHQHLGRHLDQEATRNFSKVFQSLIGNPTHLASICSDQSSGGLFIPSHGEGSDQVVKLVQDMEASQLKRTAVQAGHSPDQSEAGYKRTRSGKIVSVDMEDELMEESSDEEEQEEAEEEEDQEEDQEVEEVDQEQEQEQEESGCDGDPLSDGVDGDDDGDDGDF
jgi:hypothetical protein